MNRNTFEREGLWGYVDLGLHIQLISIFFAGVRLIRFLMLKVFGLGKLLNGWPYGHGERMNEDKTHWKDLCWFCRDSHQSSSRIVTNLGIRSDRIPYGSILKPIWL